MANMSFKSSFIPSLVHIISLLNQQGLGTQFWRHWGQVPEGMLAQQVQVAQLITAPEGLMLVLHERLCPPLIHPPSCTSILPLSRALSQKMPKHVFSDIFRHLHPRTALIVQSPTVKYRHLKCSAPIVVPTWYRACRS